MPTPTALTIDGVTYVREDAVTPAEPADVRIVILQRGWVVVGRWYRDGDDVTLTSASVIRRWGTSKGLGELVNGPLSGTKLDPAGTVRVHILGVVAALDAPGWSL